MGVGFLGIPLGLFQSAEMWVLEKWGWKLVPLVLELSCRGYTVEVICWGNGMETFLPILGACITEVAWNGFWDVGRLVPSPVCWGKCLADGACCVVVPAGAFHPLWVGWGWLFEGNLFLLSSFSNCSSDDKSVDVGSGGESASTMI